MEEKHTLNIVGIGPGDLGDLTLRAFKTLLSSDIIIGYQSYIRYLKDVDGIKNKKLIEFPMGTEIERCKTALDLAQDYNVSLISSGDAGIYGMLSLALELVDKNDLDIIINNVPGITAAVSASSLIGAPLANDFCCINLSDLLVPLDIIKKRISAALDGDFVIALYNPSSKNRKDNFIEILDLLKSKLNEETPIAIVSNAYRENEKTCNTMLANLDPDQVDMNTILLIGNSQTVFNKSNNTIYTKRGYI